MRIVTSVAELQRLSDAERAAGLRVALVPTMGALHAGHLSLVAEGRRRAERVWLSIFVNPTPVQRSARLRGLSEARSTRTSRCAARPGVDVVFAPDVAEFAPGGGADRGSR